MWQGGGGGGGGEGVKILKPKAWNFQTPLLAIQVFDW